jgi:hypothetical protein
MTTAPSNVTYRTAPPFWWPLDAASAKRLASPGIASILIMDGRSFDRQAIRIKGQGLRLMPTNDAGTRALALPSWST